MSKTEFYTETPEGLAIDRGCPELSLMWGMELRSELTFPFITESAAFPNKSVSSCVVDIRLSGSVVHREAVLSVDGSRAYLPFPQALWIGEGFEDFEHIGEKVTQFEADLAKLVHVLSGRRAADFDSYLSRANFVVVPGHPLGDDDDDAGDLFDDEGLD